MFADLRAQREADYEASKRELTNLWAFYHGELNRVRKLVGLPPEKGS